MSITQIRLQPHSVRRRTTAGISRALLAWLLLVSSLSTAGAAKKPSKAAAKKPPQPKEVLIFNNGDRITGTLLNSTGTKIKFDSEVAGQITVPLDKIKELKSDRAFAIVPKEPKKFKKREPVFEGTIQLGGKGIIITRVAPQTVAPAPVAKTATPPSSANTTAPAVVTTAPPVNVKTGQLIAANRIGYIVDDKTYQDEIDRKINWRTGWEGSITTGTTVIRATQNSYQFQAAVSLQRTIPTVTWLDPKLRTTVNYTQSAGRVSQPGTVTTVTDIFHAAAERDEYFSRRGYYLQQVNFDHDTTQGLDLQQIYGGGVGATFFKQEDSEFDLTADLHYEAQAFNSSANVTAFNRKLIGSIFSEAYSHKFGRMTFDEKTLADFAWNDENAFSASGNSAIRLPIYKKLGFSLSLIDNFQNDPQVGFQKNSLQLSTGLAFSLH